MSIEEMSEDFQLIKKMNAPSRSKTGMLTHLFAVDPERWRVVGITKDALLRLKESDFNRKGLKIHRSHKHDRFKIYSRMLIMEFANSEDWRSFYYHHDETILATSSENRRKKFSHVIPINPLDGLFKSKGYAWTHRKEERQHLKHLYKIYKNEFL